VHPFQDFFFSIALFAIPMHGHGGPAGLTTARTEERGSRHHQGRFEGLVRAQHEITVSAEPALPDPGGL
jgi:hypothetical protein